MPLPRVLCIDDNEWVGNSIGRLVRAQPGWEWLGWRASVAGLPGLVAGLGVVVVVFDVDIPGEDTFGAVREMKLVEPGARALMLSGHVSTELVDRALDAGAWGYMSKNDSSELLLRAIESVVAGEVALSPTIIEELGRIG